MNIYDINVLTKDSTGNYDLTQTTFQLITNGSVQYSTYEVQQGEEMRIDLVCQSIYGNTENCDILLNVNSIDNPLNIKEGSIIIYPNANGIELLRYSETNNTNQTEILANTNKTSRKDKSRQQYRENNLNLPPTILEETTNQFDVESTQISLGKGLF
jgi:hypothetical protein